MTNKGNVLIKRTIHQTLIYTSLFIFVLVGIEMKNMDLTKGTVFKTLCVFALHMILGNMLQQGYNIVDTWVVVSANL